MTQALYAHMNNKKIKIKKKKKKSDRRGPRACKGTRRKENFVSYILCKRKGTNK
jgi:hypothetical protein